MKYILLILMFLWSFVSQNFEQGNQNPNTSEGNLMQVATVIEEIDALILESFPMQIHLSVTGYQPDGCAVPVVVQQSRNENTVEVQIYREMPADIACPMMIVPYQENIVLDGGFTGGTVTIHVNDKTITVDL